MIEIKNLSFRYGERQIFRGESFESDAQITALSAPSGRGKTTLLRILAGLEKPETGEIRIPKPVTMLFQENRLFPGKTCRQQLQAFLPKEEDVMPWLSMVDLGEEADTVLEELSGGMQRRLALARCLVCGKNSGLLLLDEPFTGIDEARITSIMKAIRAMNIPVVFTAHEADVLGLADRIIEL